MNDNILFQFSSWVNENWTLGCVLSGITWDVIKNYLVTPLKSEIEKYTKNEEQSEIFIKELYHRKCINTKKPYRDVEDVVEEMFPDIDPEKIVKVLETYFINNTELISKTCSKKDSKESVVFNAGRDVNYINGNQFIINKG